MNRLARPSLSLSRSRLPGRLLIPRRPILPAQPVTRLAEIKVKTLVAVGVIMIVAAIAAAVNTSQDYPGLVLLNKEILKQYFKSRLPVT